jgi:histone acetyltransferase (RNA polymerase elongator complex component)
MARNGDEEYPGFEQGPIRPPSEAYSLLIRLTRNCPWNRCAFCPVYKGTEFSVRPADDVKRDIDAVHRHVETLRQLTDDAGRARMRVINKLPEKSEPGQAESFAASFHWLFRGRMKSVFLQDADNLAVKPPYLVEVLTHLRERFPDVERVTSYTRSRTVAARREADLTAIRAAGLDRLHIGLESGSDQVLKLVCKGSTKQTHIEAGRKAKAAGFEVSEYVMPGLGGRRLSSEHALESADALNQIDPDFIRLRTLAIPGCVPLAEEQRAGRFEKCTDAMVAAELLTFIENLDGIGSVVKSDHILNLFGDLEGTLPEDKHAMIALLREFLEMEPERQMLYQVGRRLGVFNGVRDLDNPRTTEYVRQHCQRISITPDNVDEFTDQIMKGYL